MTRSGDDEETSISCIRAPHPRDLQLNIEGNMFTEITYMRVWHGQTRAIATD